MTLDAAVDAFLDGRMDFEMFRQMLEEQLAQYPADAGPALARLEKLKAAGHVSAAMHAVVYEEIKRNSRGDITASIDERSGAAPPAREPVPEEAPKAVPVLTKTSDTPPPPAVLPGVGTVLAGRYRLEALLERGGTSQVFRAGDLRRSVPGSGPAKVGIKLAGSEATSRGAIEHEAALLAGLSHPGVVRMLDVDREGESAFMVMELLEGERLRSRLVRSHPDPLPQSEAIGLTGLVAEVLAYLHGQGVVHRDVKPANIFVTASGEIRLIDFGLAARIDAAQHMGAEPPKAWTPLYASPQMLAGEPPDPCDDVYSLACVAYEMLTGRHPWGNVTAPDARARKVRLTRPAGLARHQWALLRRSLSFTAAERPADAGAFLDAFFPPARPRRLLPWVAAAFISGIAAGMILQGNRPAPPTARAPAPIQERVEAPVPVVDVERPPAQEPRQAEEAGLAEVPLPVAVPPPAEEPLQAEAPAAEAPAPAVEPAVAPPPSVPARTPAPVTAPASAPAPVPAPAPAPATAPAPARAPTPAAPASFSLASNRFRVAEGAGALRLELRRPAGYRGPLNVHWRTVDQTARDGVDYFGSAGWQWAGAPPGTASLVIFIPIVDDSRPGPDLTFRIELERVSEGPPLGAPASAEVTIVDDD